jgi:hypothetical protein
VFVRGALFAAWLLVAVSALGQELSTPDDALPKVRIEALDGPLGAVKHPPRKPANDYEFRYLVKGYSELGENPLRFRIYSQDEATQKALAVPVARMLLRLWQMNYGRYGLDHAYRYNRQTVDVYLCLHGEAGGEQLFGLDPDERVDVNAIFIYDLKSFTDPLERAREVAHEYGHASLPPVGGFKDGESWVNGDLGELLYMRAIRDGLASRSLMPEDAMGLDLPAVNQYVRTEADPLAIKAAQQPPLPTLGRKDKAGREGYLGWMLYTSVLLPPNVWRRAIRLAASPDAKDWPAGVSAAIDEVDGSVPLRVPAMLKGKTFWVPVGSKSFHGAAVLDRKGGWVKVKAGAQPLLLAP